MKSFQRYRYFLVIGLSTGFFAAWLASIADYRIENRLEETKGSIEFADLKHGHPNGERLLEIQNLSSTPNIEIGELVELEFDDRKFEFCTVKNGTRAFTFCREQLRKQQSLTEVLKSDSFEARTDSLYKLDWLIGIERVDKLIDQHSSINHSEIVILGYQRDSRLKESSIALACYWIFGIAVLVWSQPGLKTNRDWLEQLSEDQTPELAKFPGALALIGHDSNNDCRRPVDNGSIALTAGSKRCRQIVPSILLFTVIASFNVWSMPICRAVHGIVDGHHLNGLPFFGFCELSRNYIGLAFLVMILLPIPLALFNFQISFLNWNRESKKIDHRKRRHWSKGYFQFHEKLFTDLGFMPMGDYTDQESNELAYFVSPSRRILVTLGVSSGATGYQIYSILSNGNLVQTCCRLDNSDRRRVQKGLSGSDFVHQQSHHDELLQALEDHETLLQRQCSDTVLEHEFHATNVIKFIQPNDILARLGKLPEWKPQFAIGGAEA